MDRVVPRGVRLRTPRSTVYAVFHTEPRISTQFPVLHTDRAAQRTRSKPEKPTANLPTSTTAIATASPNQQDKAPAEPRATPSPKHETAQPGPGST